jgi:chemotaxis protein CheZ
MNTLASEDAQVESKIVAEITSQVFRQLGHLTRQLHEALGELGLMSRLQQAASGLPDARSRLDYITRKTGEAADKVLNSVDQAKTEHDRLRVSAEAMEASLVADPVVAVASGAVLGFVQEVGAATARIDQHLTDIMIAQDFHDLTGQVVAKVIALASDLEEGLVRLLMEVAPPVPPVQEPDAPLSGPVVDPDTATGVVADQEEVDDLLASLGF